MTAERLVTRTHAELVREVQRLEQDLHDMAEQAGAWKMKYLDERKTSAYLAKRLARAQGGGE